MGFKEIINKMKQQKDYEKKLLKEAQADDKINNIIEERKKSANQREYERFMKEEKEEQYKKALEVLRKQRQHDISYNYNPTNISNITNGSDFKVMKAKNICVGKNIFSNNKNIMKNNKCIYRTKNITRSVR